MNTENPITLEHSFAKNLLLQDYAKQFPKSVAQILSAQSVEDSAEVVSLLDTRDQVRILHLFHPDRALDVLKVMEDEQIVKIFHALNPVELSSWISRMSGEAQEHYLGLLEADFANEVKEILSYPGDSAGRMMNPQIPICRPDQSVQEVLNYLKSGPWKNLRQVFVTDETGLYLGKVSLHDLAIAEHNSIIDHFLERNTPVIQATSPKHDVMDLLNRYRLESLAVIDYHGRLLGAILSATLIQTSKEEAMDNLQMMVGASPEEVALSKVGFSFRKRIPWLSINLMTAFLAAAVVGFFESSLAQLPVLAIFLPIVAGQSGNTGAQALAVTVRGLALREIRIVHWRQILRKELGVGLLNGLIIGVLTAGVAQLYYSSTALSIVVGLAMWLSSLIAGFSGGLIPLLLTKFGLDPAQSSSIFLTTVTDVAGFLIFLTFASLAMSYIQV